jgi:glucose-6-phosphate isomerase, archaeal
MNYDPGFDIEVTTSPIEFKYGAGVFGPVPEFRELGAIRQSLLDPTCDGPDPVYGIVMDVGEEVHKPELEGRQLLYGVVAYSSGQLGREPIRSQGHIHKISNHSGWSAPEVYEIWQGRAVVYIQEFVADDPGRCFAIEAGVGEKVVVPPKWAHATISVDPTQPLIFGAWCDREYGFEYSEVRARGGLAWFPLFNDGNQLEWYPNSKYRTDKLEKRKARRYVELGLDTDIPIYQLFKNNFDSFNWVSKPEILRDLWPQFVP